MFNITKNKNYLVFILPILLVIMSFVIRLIALLQTDYGNGWDAYFYLIQTKAILTEGNMHSKDISLIYPYLLLFKLIIPDYILAYKTAVALISGFYVLSLYLLAKQVSVDKNSYINALFIAAFALFSPTITYMASQFPKNLLGLVLFNFFLVFWLKDKRWIILIFFLLTFFTHRLTAGIICIFALIQLLNRRRLLWMLIIGVILFSLTLVLPGIIHFYDIERFRDVFSFNLQFAPFSFTNLIGFEKIGYYWMAEMIVLFLFLSITIISLIFYRQHIEPYLQKFYFTLILISFVLLFPFFKFDINGPALRFFLTFLCIAPVFIPFLSEKMNKTFKMGLVFLLIITSLFSYLTYSPKNMDPPYYLYNKITERTRLLLKNKTFDIVVAHKGLAEYFTFTSGIDALPWQPESKYPIDKTWRISSGISLSGFRYYFKEDVTDSINKIGIDYFLLPESLWQRFIRQVKLKDDLNLMQIVYSDKNPYRVRPDYLKGQGNR